MIELGHVFKSFRGLTNSFKETPKLLGVEKIDVFRTRYTLDNNGVSIKDFEDNAHRIEAAFGTPIESVQYGNNSKRILR